MNGYDYKYPNRYDIFDSLSHVINGYVYLLYEKFLKYVTYKGKKITALEFLELRKDSANKRQFKEHLKYDFNDITPISLKKTTPISLKETTHLKKTKSERCKKGTHRNKVNGNCDQISLKETKRTPKEIKRERCKNGTRRNKVTGMCDPK
jgi:hypothetical protein